MSNDLLFGLAVFLSGTWYVTLDAIIRLGSQEPSDRSVLALAVAHFVLFIYVVLAFASFFRRGLDSVTGQTEAQDDPIASADLVLFSTWPAALLAVLLALACNSLPGFSPEMSGGIFIGSFIVLLAVTLKFNHEILSKFGTIPRLAGLGAIFVFGFILYVLAMSFLFAGVTVTQDQEIHDEGAMATFYVKSKGYVLLPYITEVELMDSKYDTPNIASSNMMFSKTLHSTPAHAGLVDWSGPYYGRVTFRLQIPSMHGKSYFPVRIRPTQQ